MKKTRITAYFLCVLILTCSGLHLYAMNENGKQPTKEPEQERPVFPASPKGIFEPIVAGLDPYKDRLDYQQYRITRFIAEQRAKESAQKQV